MKEKRLFLELDSVFLIVLSVFLAFPVLFLGVGSAHCTVNQAAVVATAAAAIIALF